MEHDAFSDRMSGAPTELPFDDVAQGGAGASVRAFTERDIPSVVELFGRTFRPGKRYDADALAACIRATYFEPPAYTPDTGSIVHLDGGGRVDGFLGIIPITMRFEQRIVRGGILSAYMAHDPERNPGIGIGLVRAVRHRGFDVIFTDTANRTSLDIARGLRFITVPAQSLEWVAVLRPAGTALHFLRKRWPRAASWLQPIVRGGDVAYAKLRPSPDADGRSLKGTMVRAIDAATFVDGADAFLESYALKPAWNDRTELGWFVAQAGLQTKYGALNIRDVVDRRGRRVGLYLLYAQPGGVAYALQILARTNHEDIVVANLIADARRLGAVAVRGATSDPILSGLFRQTGIFYHHVMGTTAWTADPDIADALRAGHVLLGGLAGETWTRLVTETFA